MKNKSYDIAVVGAGPAGLSAAYILASSGLSIVVLDKGSDYDSRILDSSVGKGDLLCGIGGAGTLSGGKLCGIPASMELWRKTKYALPTFNDFLHGLPLPLEAKRALSPGEIRLADERNANEQGLSSKSYPSALLLKNDMQSFIHELYSRARAAGCEIVAQQAVTDVRSGAQHFTLEIMNRVQDSVFASAVLFASGRSSAGSIGNLLRRTKACVMSQSTDLGIRLCIPHSASDLFTNFGQDVKLKQEIAAATVRTFCVCSGGDSAFPDLDGVAYADGHFTDHLTKNVNLGIVSRIPTIGGYHAARRFAEHMGGMLTGKNMSIPEFMKRHPHLAQDVSNGIFQEHIETIGVFLRNLIKIGGITGNLDQCEVVGATIDRYWPRVETNQFFETHQPGLYVIGDAAGISRGYIQSMWSAHCAAHAIVKKMNGIQYEKVTINERIESKLKNDRFLSLAA
jgi:uncharacterized FAD-dependent dehydrogenase